MDNLELSYNDFTLYVEDTSAEGNELENECLKNYLNASIEILSEFLSSNSLGLPEGKVEGFELSLNLCADDQIKQLNNEYRGKDKVTDVLSFPVHDSLRPGEVDEMFLESLLNLGDVIICKSVAKKQSVEFKVTYEQEIVHLLVHGVLHLSGFDHEVSEEEEIIMVGHEEKLVEKIYKKNRFIKWKNR